jgi:hypothetical protein
VLKLQDRRSDVGGNADAKLGSRRMAARATARSRSCGSPDFDLVRGQKIWSQDAGERKYRHRGVCFGDSALCGWAHRCHRRIESATRTSAPLMPSITPADAHCEQVIKREEASSRSVAFAFGILREVNHAYLHIHGPVAYTNKSTVIHARQLKPRGCSWRAFPQKSRRSNE